MVISRMTRFEERKQQRRLVLSLMGILAVVVFLGLFGLKILVNFSLLVDRIRGTSPVVPQAQQLILAPVLDPLPQATNSATVSVTGSGQSGLTLVVYLNEREVKKLTIGEDGTFRIPSLTAAEGANSVSAKLIDDKGNMSDLSNVVSIQVRKTPPPLDIASPEDNATINGDSNTVGVNGKTLEDVSVTINDRYVVVRSDGSFSYNYPLNEGDNTIRILATDLAGNQTLIERRVKYQK